MNNNFKDEIFLSVVIPAYNEAHRIANTLKKIRKYLDRQDYSSEIIVVSDGCTDATDSCATESLMNWPNFRILCRVENRGKGYSVKEGILHCRGRLILFTDADLSTSAENWDTESNKFQLFGEIFLRAMSISLPALWKCF